MERRRACVTLHWKVTDGHTQQSCGTAVVTATMGYQAHSFPGSWNSVTNHLARQSRLLVHCSVLLHPGERSRR